MEDELKQAGLENSVFSQIHQQARDQLASEYKIGQKKQPNSKFRDFLGAYWLFVVVLIFSIFGLLFGILRRKKKN